MLRSIIIASLLLVLFTSCKKDEEPATNSAIQTVTCTDVNVKNYQVISLLVKNGTLNNAQYTGTFGGAAVDILRYSDSTLCLLVPAGISGAQDLVFSLNDQSCSFHFQVQSHTLSQTPDQVLTGYSNFLQGYIDDMSAADAKSQAQDSLNLFNVNVASMSAAEKQMAAYIIEVNDSIFTSMISYLDDLSGDDLSAFMRTNINSCAYTDFTDKAVCMLGRHHYGLFMLVKCVAAGTLFSYLFPKMKAVVIVGVFAGVWLLKMSFDDIELLMADLKELIVDPVFTQRTQALSYVSGTAVAVPLRMKRANLQNTPYAFAPFNTFKSDFDRLCDYIDDKCWGLVSNPSFKPYTEKEFSAERLSFLSVSVSGNSNVTAVLTGTGAAPMLKFTNATSTNQTFSFTLTYNDGMLSHSKTFTGAVVAPQPASVQYNFVPPPSPGYVQDNLGQVGCCNNIRRYYLLNVGASVAGSTLTITNFSAHDSTLFQQIQSCTPVCSNPGTRYILGNPSTGPQATISPSNNFTVTFNSTNYVTPVTVTGTVTATQITGNATFNGKTIPYTMAR